MSNHLDEVRGDVTAGEGWVLRLPGLVAVVSRQDDEEAAIELIALIRDSLAELGPSPGREMTPRLTRWLVDTPDAPGFGTVTATSDGIAVLLHGEVEFRETGCSNSVQTHLGLELSGSTAALTVDRLMAWPTRPVALTIGRASTLDPDFGDRASNGPIGLLQGLVPGKGVILGSDREPGRVEKAGPEVGSTRATGKHAQRTDSSRPPELAPGAADKPPEIADPSVEGLTSGPRPERAEESPGVVVEGILCSRSHLNDPRVAFCASCGIRMDHRTAVPVHGRRPPLGLLLLDDGAIYVLDDDYLLGRQPEADREVLEGRFRPIRLDDESNLVSRSHAVVRLQHWDAILIDHGSANGTYVAGPAETAYNRLVPHEPFVLLPGMQVRIGHRTFTFQSARAEL